MASQPSPRCPDCAHYTAEAAALRPQVEALTALVESLAAQVQDLQQRLDRNSSNSSRPPSSDPPWKPKPNRGNSGERKRGGQKGHPGQQRAWVPAADLSGRFEYVPEVCTHCLAAIPVDTPLADEVWAHQVYELPEIRPEVSEYLRRSCACPQCGKRTWAPLPPGVPTSGTGPRLQAAVSLLTGKGQMSRRNVQHCLTSWCKLPLGLGTISKIERRLATALAPAVAEVTAAIHTAPVVYYDETRWREGATKP